MFDEPDWMKLGRSQEDRRHFGRLWAVATNAVSPARLPALLINDPRAAAISSRKSGSVKEQLEAARGMFRTTGTSPTSLQAFSPTGNGRGGRAAGPERHSSARTGGVVDSALGRSRS